MVYHEHLPLLLLPLQPRQFFVAMVDTKLGCRSIGSAGNEPGHKAKFSSVRARRPWHWKTATGPQPRLVLKLLSLTAYVLDRLRVRRVVRSNRSWAPASWLSSCRRSHEYPPLARPPLLIHSAGLCISAVSLDSHRFFSNSVRWPPRAFTNSMRKSRPAAAAAACVTQRSHLSALHWSSSLHWLTGY